MPAACNPVNVKSTLTLMNMLNMFLRIFVFIRFFWFVCPFTEVLQEIRRDNAESWLRRVKSLNR